MIGHFSHCGSSLARDSDCILFQPDMNQQPVGAFSSKAKGGLLSESVEPAGSSVALSSATSANPTFTADVAGMLCRFNLRRLQLSHVQGGKGWTV